MVMPEQLLLALAVPKAASLMNAPQDESYAIEGVSVADLTLKDRRGGVCVGQ
jgi:hypothetical protein